MLCTRQKDNGPFASFDRIKIILFVFTSNNFIVYVQTLLSDIIHERKYKIHDGVRIRYDFSSGYANFKNLPVKAQQAQNQTSPLLSLSKGADALIIIGILGLVAAIIVGIMWMRMTSARVPSEPSFSIFKV